MKYAWVNGIILDGTKDMKPLNHKIILSNGKWIEDIVDEGYDISKYEVIDLNHQYIMPGLINLKVHLPASGNFEKKGKKMSTFITNNPLFRIGVRKMGEHHAKKQLMSGVTTICTMGSLLDMDSRVRAYSEHGAYLARVLGSNMALSFGQNEGLFCYEAISKEEVEKYVKEIIKTQPNILNLIVNGELDGLTEYIKLACDEAHRHGIVVNARVEGEYGLKEVLKHGVDLVSYDGKLDSEMLNLLLEKKTAYVTTLSSLFVKVSSNGLSTNELENVQSNTIALLNKKIDALKACLDAGVLVGLGSNSGCFHVMHYDMWRELYYFHKYCAATNQFALHTATQINAKIAGIDHVTGVIQKGKCADFIITKDNPLDDLSALRNVNMVCMRGELIKQPKVRKRKQVETELDQFL